MQEQDLLNNIEKVSGTSIGSLIAAMIALKVDIRKLIDKLFEINLNMFTEEKSYIQLGKHASILTGNELRKIVNDFLKLKDAEFLTLKQAYEKTKIQLFLTVTNLNQEKVVYLNYKTHPDLLLKDAIMMSTALPGIFPRIIYNNEEYVDGAVIDNFPTSVLSKHAWGIRTAKSEIELPKGPLSNLEYISKLISIRYENSKHNTVHIEKIIPILINDVTLTSFDING